MKMLYNLLCRDIDAQLHFYAALLGLPEIPERRTPIYRALHAGDSELGFNAWPAYGLLGLGHRAPGADAPVPPVTGFPTFMLESPTDIDRAAERAPTLGGRVVKPPYASYYSQWQALLADREGQVLRLACLALPPGISPAPKPF